MTILSFIRINNLRDIRDTALFNSRRFARLFRKGAGHFIQLASIRL